MTVVVDEVQNTGNTKVRYAGGVMHFTLAEAQAFTLFKVGDRFLMDGREKPYKVVLDGTGTNDGWSYVDSTADATLQFEYQHDDGGVVSALYDFAVDGGAVGTINLPVSIPDNATIVRAYYEVLTAFTSGGAATVAFGVSTDDAAGLKAATAYNDASYAAGYGDFIPDGVAANFTTKTTGVRSIDMVIATAALTAGKVRVWVEYVVSE